MQPDILDADLNLLDVGGRRLMGTRTTRTVAAEVGNAAPETAALGLHKVEVCLALSLANGRDARFNTATRRVERGALPRSHNFEWSRPPSTARIAAS